MRIKRNYGVIHCTVHCNRRSRRGHRPNYQGDDRWCRPLPRGVSRTGTRCVENHDIVDPAPDKWYPPQGWLDAFSAIAEELEPHLLDRIGEQIHGAADWPSDPSGVVAGLQSNDEASQRNHRGGEIGYDRFTHAAQHTGKVESENPFRARSRKQFAKYGSRSMGCPKRVLSGRHYGHGHPHPCRLFLRGRRDSSRHDRLHRRHQYWHERSLSLQSRLPFAS